MQNVQNTDIQQRVMNLVDLYRNKVSKESQKAKSLAGYYKEQYDQEIEIAIRSGINGSLINIDDIPENEVDFLRANEQLLGYFYKDIAGEEADQKVLTHLLAEKYDSTVFTKEEVSFLKDHFADMVNYIIQTPNNDLEAIGQNDRRDLYLIPEEVLELIKSRVEIPTGATVYNPFTGFAQFATLYPDCSFFCEDSYYPFFKKWNEYCDRLRKETNIVKGKINEDMVWPWMKVALYANHIDVDIIEDGKVPQVLDAAISYLPEIPFAIPNTTIPDTDEKSKDPEIINKIQSSYNNLVDGGKMVLILPKEYLWKSDYSSLRSLWSKMIEDGALVEIIQLPAVMGKTHHEEDFCIIIAEKGRSKNLTTLIDARFAAKDVENKYFDHILDLDSIHSMLENEGKEDSTGLRKMVEVPMKNLNIDFLLPQTYVIERPLESEKPVPLSALCTLETTLIRDVQYNLSEDTPWITMGDLTPLYTGYLDFTGIRKADCPNNPAFAEGSEDYEFSSSGKFIDNFWAQMNTKKGCHVLEYRQCTFLNGKTDVVLYERSVKHGVQVAVVRATGKPYAVSSGILVFYPKDGFDANSLAALLRLPIVYRQLVAYQEHGIGNHLDDILVPTDKRVIGDELSRMKKEESVTKEIEEDFETGQKKHMTKLEDYQHAMRKHIREISSSIRRMERFINGMESSKEIKSFLHERLEVIKSHRLYLSEDIERLNEENTYGKAVPFDIDHCLKSFKDYFGYDAYPIAYSNEVAQEALKQYIESHRKELNDMNNADRSKIIARIKEEMSFAYVDIAEYNFCKVVRNILENARIHGFSTDISRNDYKIEIILTWNSERKMYQIDFRNNGDPLPDGLSKDSYGENRKYAGKTGGTGIGGYEVADTVKHYKGDYAISQDGDWVVVSVYLPKSKSYEEGV